MSGNEHRDHEILLRSNSSASEDDIEGQGGHSYGTNRRGIRDILKRLDRGFSGRRRSSFRNNHESSSADHSPRGDNEKDSDDDTLGDGAPPEWALLLIGCALGLATGILVAAFNRGLLLIGCALGLATGILVTAFNRGVHLIHEWVWAGTPNEGAAWLRLQSLADTWHRVLLVPVTGGVIVGVMHGLVEILDQIRQSITSQGEGFDLLAGFFPTVKATQAAITLGTGCSLGPEGPSVDIGKSCANGFSLMMENDRERKIALMAAGAAAGISAGFNAAVAGCFFAIETVLRPLRAENCPPFTTAMIILASVISSTVSNAILGEKEAFTVPSYTLKSAAELPLYLILGMVCGVVSVVFNALVIWFDKAFEFIRERFGVPAVVCPALGGLGVGLIALKYPGVLYWGFSNVNEILHTGKSASAPGIGLLAQLAAAKVVATALCKGSGLVGGLYAPSLMIGAAVGAVFGGVAGDLINSAIPGNAVIAQPQAYALVGMAATLASVCSVPLTSVLLLFELTKDYMILLPLLGAVGLAIWVPSVTNQTSTSATPSKSLTKGYSALSHTEDRNDAIWRAVEEENGLELSVMGNGENIEVADEDIFLENMKVSKAMLRNFVKVSPSLTLKEAIKSMHDNQHHCLLVVDAEDFLEGVLTYGDIKRFLSRMSSDDDDVSLQDLDTFHVSSICTRGISYRGQERGILTCYPDTDLATAKKLMEAKGIKQLPVIKRGGDFRRERKRKVVAVLYYNSISISLRDEINHRKSIFNQRKEENRDGNIGSGH